MLGVGWGVRLIVGFQPLMVISLPASCLVWAERSTPDNFGCQATDSDSTLAIPVLFHTYMCHNTYREMAYIFIIHPVRLRMAPN